jgi:hypothetical protein
MLPRKQTSKENEDLYIDQNASEKGALRCTEAEIADITLLGRTSLGRCCARGKPLVEKGLRRYCWWNGGAYLESLKNGERFEGLCGDSR